VGAINSALALVGAAKQTAKGSPAANPAYAHGVSGGQVMTLEIEQEPDDVTAGSRVYAQVNRTSATAGADWESRLYPASLGLWLYATFGNLVTTGAGPYSHAFTAGDDVPYLTTFGRFGPDYYSVQDFKVDQAEMSWDGTEPVEFSLSGMGTIPEFAGPTAWTPTTDDSRSRYLVPVGGTFELAAAGPVPVTARVRAGSISISNNLETILLSGSVVPEDVHVGRQEYEVSLTVVPENMNLWRETVTGAANGTEVDQCPVFGSFSVEFVDPCDPAAVSLTIEGLKVAFMADFPEADPGGAPAELELSGVPILPASGAALTATLVNAVATY
jgi:hypothetical protein